MANIFDLFKSIEKTEPQGAPEYLIVGLGNPGSEYAYIFDYGLSGAENERQS